MTDTCAIWLQQVIIYDRYMCYLVNVIVNYYLWMIQVLFDYCYSKWLFMVDTCDLVRVANIFLFLHTSCHIMHGKGPIWGVYIDTTMWQGSDMGRLYRHDYVARVQYGAFI